MLRSQIVLIHDKARPHAVTETIFKSMWEIYNLFIVLISLPVTIPSDQN